MPCNAVCTRVASRRAHLSVYKFYMRRFNCIFSISRAVRRRPYARAIYMLCVCVCVPAASAASYVAASLAVPESPPSTTWTTFYCTFQLHFNVHARTAKMYSNINISIRRKTQLAQGVNIVHGSTGSFAEHHAQHRPQNEIDGCMRGQSRADERPQNPLRPY